MTPLYDAVKRSMDVLLGGGLFVISLPVHAAVAAAVRWKLGSPVYFRQQRPGRDGVVFDLIKFRTMLEVDVAEGRVTDEDRMTPLGAFLRASSLDEIPSLWNVLKGDMSLVGPRPLLVQYLPRYSPEQARRHEVRPGITGLAQVSGRNAISWGEKFAKDVEYVDNRSLRLDVSILWATIGSVLGRRGISADGSVTMPEFRGDLYE